MLRIEIFQPNACYRIPQIGNPILTYPLAPPSTVLGLLRSITSYRSINKDNTKIAISGIYESKLRHIITNHITGISDVGKYKSNIIPTEELFNIHHIIHIQTDDSFEKLILDNIQKATRFGRQEDLITKIECKSIENQNTIEWNNLDLTTIKNITYYLYIPYDRFKSLNALAMFNTPLDSSKDLLDQGFLKMFFQKLLFLRLQRLIMNLPNKEKLLLDQDGYCYVWIN